MRAFVGLSVPDPWIAPLMRAQARLPGGRAVDADDLHVTLAFLDDQPEARLEALHDALEGRLLPGATLIPAAYVPLGKRPNLVALDLAPDPRLAALRDLVRGCCRSAGIDLPRERFRPHVTLIRFPAARPPSGRLPSALAGIGAPALAPAPAAQAVLWSSTLTPDGPIYDALATYPLGAP